ncbi:hypothetical protein HG542_28785, partial [Streptomyces morookaense]|nr:hypothetical protein [Streptomyces morookaense]
MQGSLTAVRTDHRRDVEELLERAVEEEVRRSGGRTDGEALLRRGRAELDSLAAAAAEEYAAYTRALDEEATSVRPLGSRLSRASLGTPALATAAAAIAACAADLGLGTSGGTA